MTELLNNAIGPNNWDAITPDDFGYSFDYIAEDHGSIVVLDPTSKAALEWMYRHLPEDCPRWGKLGFCVERNYVADVLAGMSRDGLLSEFDYERAMNEEQQLQNQAADYRGSDYGDD
jgi:hypothetical protein